MQTILSDRSVGTILVRDVVIESRKKIPEIAEYLQNTIHQLKALSYVFDDFFDAQKAFDLLNKDLPDGHLAGQKECFIHDVVRLCSLFYRLKKSKKMRVHIGVIQTNMCRLFHQDNYRQRLLCTYKGPGTEWLEHSNVNREALGKGCNDKLHRQGQ